MKSDEPPQFFTLTPCIIYSDESVAGESQPFSKMLQGKKQTRGDAVDPQIDSHSGLMLLLLLCQGGLGT